MGTPGFAVAPLRAMLEEGFDVAAVVTAADKPAGRGRKLRQSPVKEYALSCNLPVLQPLNLKDPGFIEELRSFHANLQVIVAFRMLPEVVWTMPGLGTFNLHASILPQYRGAAPINWAIINGETETGITTFFLTHELDTGNVLFQEKMPILPDDTAGSLHDRLSAAGAQLVVKTLQAIQHHTYELTDQDTMTETGIELKKAPKIYKEDCILDWRRPATQLHNLVRGLNPFPGAVITLVSPGGKSYSIKLFRTSIEFVDSLIGIGNILTDGKSYLEVKASDAFIRIHELQLEGKKKLPVADFLRGFPVDNQWSMK